MSQILSVALVVVPCAIAIIAVLLWKLHPDTSSEAKFRDLLTRWEAREAELSAAKAETATANQKAAEAVRMYAASHLDNNSLRDRIGTLAPIAEQANAARETAAQRLRELEQKHDERQEKHIALLETQRQAMEKATEAETQAEHWKQEAAALSIRVNVLQEELVLGTSGRGDVVVGPVGTAPHTLHEAIEEAKRDMQEIAEGLPQPDDSEMGRHAQTFIQTLAALQQKLREYDGAVEDLQRSGPLTYGVLKEQINALKAAEQRLHSQSHAFAEAIGDDPQMQDSPGDLMLRQLVEFVGMQEYCEFPEQDPPGTEGGPRSADMIIHLPKGQRVTVDAKAIMDACREAENAPDEVHRARHMKQHYENVKSRIREISSDDYRKRMGTRAEVMALFIPAKNLYATAVENDLGMTQYALDRNVVICGPNALMMLLKVASQMWQRATIEQGAERVRKAGVEVYSHACAFVAHYAKVGSSIKQAADDYDSSLGVLDTRLIPAGRRLAALSSQEDAAAITAPLPVDVSRFKFRSREARQAEAAQDKGQ